MADEAVLPLALLLPADSPRVSGEDAEHACLLAELDADLPPIVVHRGTMRVIDGIHRVRAAKIRGRSAIAARFFDGTEEEAFVLAVELNVRHGLPLSRGERSSAALRIIESHGHWSNAKIASVCGLSDKTVAALRRGPAAGAAKPDGRIGRDGRVRPLDPAKGRLRAGAILQRRPDAPLREVAEEAGIAVATAKDVRERLKRGAGPLPPRLAKGKQAGESEPDGGVPVPVPVRGGRTPEVVSLDRYAEALALLGRDPSIRLTDAGRSVLRLLGMHMIDDEKWVGMIENMPSHCDDALAEVARRCASLWTRFVGALEVRADR
jgi:ParB-like chromosome segregation protein Spo0J